MVMTPDPFIVFFDINGTLMEDEDTFCENYDLMYTDLCGPVKVRPGTIEFMNTLGRRNVVFTFLSNYCRPFSDRFIAALRAAVGSHLVICEADDIHACRLRQTHQHWVDKDFSHIFPDPYDHQRVILLDDDPNFIVMNGDRAIQAHLKDEPADWEYGMIDRILPAVRELIDRWELAHGDWQQRPSGVMPAKELIYSYSLETYVYKLN